MQCLSLGAATLAISLTTLATATGQDVAESPPVAPKPSGDAIEPATDMQFVEMLQGCWNKPNSVGSSTACFFPDGGVAFLAYNASDKDALADGGRYSVEGGKVRIEGTGDAWPFTQNAVSCDGFIEPLETLILAQCDGGLSDSISDTQWVFESRLEACQYWCDMVRYD